MQSMAYPMQRSSQKKDIKAQVIAGKLASLDRSWQSKEGTYRALGMAGIEPTPPESHVTGPRFRLNHSAKGAVQLIAIIDSENLMPGFPDCAEQVNKHSVLARLVTSTVSFATSSLCFIPTPATLRPSAMRA